MMTGKKILNNKNKESTDVSWRHGKRMDYQQINNTSEKVH